MPPVGSTSPVPSVAFSPTHPGSTFSKIGGHLGRRLTSARTPLTEVALGAGPGALDGGWGEVPVLPPGDERDVPVEGRYMMCLSSRQGSEASVFGIERLSV